jgi:hypothetical protein
LAWINANADIDEMNRKALTIGFANLNRDDGRKNAGKEGVQGATTVRVVCAFMVRATTVVMMGVLVVGVQSRSSREGLCAR